MKRIYSLNLISFLKSKKFKVDSIGYDEETGKVYYVFPENKEVGKAIREYKNPKATVVLHDFVENFKVVKKEIFEYLKEIGVK